MSKRFVLGRIELDSPFILAPMAAITNSPYRRLMRRLESGCMISELVSVNAIEHINQRTLEMLAFHEEERPVALQIFGDDNELLCKAAQKAEELGYDFVDLNMGCPVPKVVKRGAGAAMCRDTVSLGKTLEALVKSVKIPVTIKIRTGWDANTRNANEVVHVAAESGVNWVAIHGRTRAQGYSGLSDWDFIAEVKAKSRIPILGNGDLTKPEQAVEYYKKYGVDAVLIGRGALRNPFIFKQSKQILNGDVPMKASLDLYLKLMTDQRAILEQNFNPKYGMQQAKKFLAWYSAGFPGCAEFRGKIFNFNDPNELWETGFNFFKAAGASRDWAFLSEPFLMGGHG